MHYINLHLLTYLLTYLLSILEIIGAKSDGSGSDNWSSIRRVKLHSKCHLLKTKTQRFTGRMPFLSPNQQCQSTEGKKYHTHGLSHPKLIWGLPTSYLGECCQASRHSPDASATNITRCGLRTQKVYRAYSINQHHV